MGALSTHSAIGPIWSRWLSEGKKSNWAVHEMDCDPEGGGLEEILPFSAIFRVSILGTPLSPEPCVTLQSMSSGHFLSRPKEREALGTSKIAKSAEVVNISCHPVWNMSKGKNLFPIYEKEGALFCGPGNNNPCFFEVLVLDWSRVSLRLDSKDEKKGVKSSKFFELKKKRTKRTSVADVSGIALSNSATPPSSPLQAGPSPPPPSNGTPPEKGLTYSNSIDFPSTAKQDEVFPFLFLFDIFLG